MYWNVAFTFAGTFGSVSMVEDSSGEPPPETPELEDVALALEAAADKEERERDFHRLRSSWQLVWLARLGKKFWFEWETLQNVEWFGKQACIFEAPKSFVMSVKFCASLDRIFLILSIVTTL